MPDNETICCAVESNSLLFDRTARENKDKKKHGALAWGGAGRDRGEHGEGISPRAESGGRFTVRICTGRKREGAEIKGRGISLHAAGS